MNIKKNISKIKNKKSTKKTKKKLGYHSKNVPHAYNPGKMTDKEWQTRLRQQIAEKEIFEITNIGSEKIYSDYQVVNIQFRSTYKVALRSKDNTLNFCSCPDFKTNLLGTCKHIEAVRLNLSKKRGFKLLSKIIPELPYSSLYVSYNERREVKIRVGSENKNTFQIWSKQYFDANNVLLPAAFAKIENVLNEAQNISPSFRCYTDALDLIIEKRTEEKRKKLVESKGNQLLKGLSKVELFPYQFEGILFAAKAGRSILADEMGLGKTIQAITWALLLKKHFDTTKVVIICPTSLKYQWKAEIEKFTGMKSCVVEGNVLARKSIYKSDENYFKIVSYHVAGNDWNYINEMQPDIIILDEAQRIKNWRTAISRNIKRIHSLYTMVLTGTPVENNIEELFSIVQYVNPYILGSLYHYLSEHQLKDESGKIVGYKGLNEIGHSLSNTMLRRTRKQVLKQLPSRMDKNLFIPITTEQYELHEQYADTVAKLVSKWKRFGFLTEKERQILLNCLNMMRMVCDSTFIIDQKTNYQTKLDELFNILDELFIEQDAKVVIFSQWERMTRLIANGLKERKIKFENLHGSIPSKDREKLFTNFNNDPECRVFLSTDAGGVGLNLQSASNMINMDIPWNPAVLEQRIGRIYRMGQKKNVSIINLIAQNTIEHKMISTLKFKTAIADGILDGGDDNIFAGDDKFNKFMHSVEEITSSENIEPSTFDQDEKLEISLPLIQPNKEDNTRTSFEEIYEEEENKLTEKREQFYETNIANSNALIESGVSFLSQLMHTLNDSSATKELVKNITEKDELTGKTYLKIPIQDNEVVENALSFLAKLFSK